MKINEIIILPSQSFEKHTIEGLIPLSTKIDTIEKYELRLIEHNTDRILLVVDETLDLKAYAGFMSARNDTVWVAKNVQSWANGQRLAAKLYVYVLRALKKNLQSDFDQTTEGRKLWTVSLPAIGIIPKVLDTETGKVYDRNEKNPYDGAARFVWCISENVANITESPSSLLQVILGKWYHPKKGII